MYLSRNQKFFIITGSLVIIYFFTDVLNTTVGHLLAFFIIGLYIYLTLNTLNDSSEVFYNEITSKINNLSENKNETDYLYLDPDLVIMFDEIKYDFYNYNKEAFHKALSCANNVLKSLNTISTPVCKQIKVPFSLDNFDTGELQDLNPNIQDCKGIPRNSYQTFIFAKEQYSLCINYLHSFILTIPAQPSTHFKHKQIMDRSRLLLRRDLDKIKDIYNKNTDLTNNQINNYDTFVPYNEQTGEIFENTKNIKDSFRFF